MPSSNNKATVHRTTETPVSKRAVLAVLKASYPVLNQYSPLKLDIEEDLFARCSFLSRSKIKRGLRYHLRSRRYILAIAQGGQRYDLDGKPAGDVTAEEQQQALETVHRRDAEELERKKLQYGIAANRSAA